MIGSSNSGKSAPVLRPAIHPQCRQENAARALWVSVGTQAHNRSPDSCSSIQATRFYNGDKSSWNHFSSVEFKTEPPRGFCAFKDESRWGVEQHRSSRPCHSCSSSRINRVASNWIESAGNRERSSKKLDWIFSTWRVSIFQSPQRSSRPSNSPRIWASE